MRQVAKHAVKDVYVYVHTPRSDYCPTIKVDGFEVISVQICGKLEKTTILIVKLLP
jgi:hypothetical protein